MKRDISHILAAWDYKPGQVVVRRFKGRDGQEKLQLRLDLGILQLNAEGRPDGKRPLGHESVFHHFVSLLEQHRKSCKGEDTGFVLRGEDCARLQMESIQYHHRLICRFQLGDYDGVVRDAERNLEVFAFVTAFAESPELAWSLQQFRPQLLLMLTRARGTRAMSARQRQRALQIIEAGIESLRGFYREHDRLDLMEHSGEIESLEAWLEGIRSKRARPTSRRRVSHREKLERALNDAVTREDYELAAKFRDALRSIQM